MTFNRNFIKYWLPVISWMCFIFWMSTEAFSSQNTFSWIETALRFLVPKISYQDVGLVHTFIRKTGHVAEYFILGLLLFRAFCGGSNATWNWGCFFFAVMIMVLWAAGDEFHQSFVSTRTASPVDVAIDTAGGILGQFGSALWHLHRRK
jgi:VanZ family protein